MTSPDPPANRRWQGWENLTMRKPSLGEVVAHSRANESQYQVGNPGQLQIPVLLCFASGQTALRGRQNRDYDPFTQIRRVRPGDGCSTPSLPHFYS